MRPLSPEYVDTLIRMASTPTPDSCPHEDIRYSAAEKGAVACHVCGRLFGHLQDEYFYAFNPR